jgi:hypothetical protein
MAEHYTTLSFVNVLSSKIPSPTSKYRFNMEYGKNKSLTIIHLMNCLSIEVPREFIKVVQNKIYLENSIKYRQFFF